MIGGIVVIFMSSVVGALGMSFCLVWLLMIYRFWV